MSNDIKQKTQDLVLWHGAEIAAERCDTSTASLLDMIAGHAFYDDVADCVEREHSALSKK